MSLVTLAAVCAAALGYFSIRWLQFRRGYAALSETEKRRAEIAAIRGLDKNVSLRERLQLETKKLGLGDNAFPLYAGAIVGYLGVAAPLSVQLPLWMALLAAFPGAAVVGYVATAMLARARRKNFNRQMIDLLDLTVSQIQGGVGAERALNIVVPQMPDPMRSEMTRALAAGQAGKDLVGAMKELSQRYPSRAFDMFVAALEIDRAEGHAIAPALSQAAALLKQDFTLAAEANAKLGQVKNEFYAVAFIISGIAVYLIVGGPESVRQAYTTLGGWIVIGLAVANAAAGFARFRKKINSLVGDTV